MCFCTLAIHGPYRERARLLVRDVPEGPWVVLTDEPGEFAGLPVRAIKHQPTGPMAIDFGTRLPPMGNVLGEPAYHDKRFALQAALEEFDTAIFVDADTRVNSLPRLPVFRPGIAVTKDVNASIAEHLSRWGPHRRPLFEKLGVELTCDVGVIESARLLLRLPFDSQRRSQRRSRRRLGDANQTAGGDDEAWCAAAEVARLIPY